MKLGRIVEELKLKVITGSLDVEIKRGCCGDLLSEIMRSCEKDSIWVTIQSHVNIVAVAVVVGIRAIVLCNGHEYSEDTLKKADEEGITLLASDLTPFEVSGRIYMMLKES
ncbi:MAG: iron-sulfur binding hydrogenase [Thermotoga sp.]|nr:MAG: iron-sulfur binding hydrogenase [Thermotoga sp.]